MSESRAALERECRTFTRYLVGRDPSPYVVEKYCEAHATLPAFRGGLFDEQLTRVARWRPLAAFAADAYARFFAPRGALRKKLVLALAILETSPPFFREFERPPGGGRAGQALRLGTRLLVFVATLFVATIVFLPVHLLAARRGRTGR